MDPSLNPPKDQKRHDRSRNHHRREKNPTADRELQSAAECMTAGAAVGQARAKADEDAAENSQRPAPSLTRTKSVRPHLWQLASKRHCIVTEARCEIGADGNADDQHKLPVDDRFYFLPIGIGGNVFR